MASISTGGGHGGKRAVDHEIPLIPFIDLLLCCVMFLLVTAVWNQLAQVQASLRSPSETEQRIEPPPPLATIVVHVASDQVIVAGEAGDRIEIPNLDEGRPDLVALIDQLAPRHAGDPSLVVVADDGVRFESVIATMDAVAGAGFERVTMSDGI